MKKSVIWKVGVVALVVVAVGGCQTGPSDQKLIKTTMADWKAALTDQNLDKIIETYSEDFESEMASGKEEMRQFMTRVFDSGWVDDAEVDLESMETTIEGDQAEVSGVELLVDSGPMTLDFTLQKEKGAWLIVNSESDR